MSISFLPCHIFLKERFACQEVQALIQGGHCEAAGGDPRHDLPDILVPGGLLDCLWSSQSEPFFPLAGWNRGVGGPDHSQPA